MAGSCPAADARHLAGEVEKLLRARAAALAKHKNDPDLVFNFWDQVTLAEALLLLGDFTGVRQIYLDAFGKHPEQMANIKVSRTQMGEILRALGAAGAGVDFLEGS